MRRLTAWVGGAVGGIIAYRWWRRRPEAVAEPPAGRPQEQPDERAEELRAKLAESRESDAPPPVEHEEPPPASADQPSAAVEERRQRVHDEGGAALDEMKSDGAES